MNAAEWGYTRCVFAVNKYRQKRQEHTYPGPPCIQLWKKSKTKRFASVQLTTVENNRFGEINGKKKIEKQQKATYARETRWARGVNRMSETEKRLHR